MGRDAIRGVYYNGVEVVLLNKRKKPVFTKTHPYDTVHQVVAQV